MGKLPHDKSPAKGNGPGGSERNKKYGPQRQRSQANKVHHIMVELTRMAGMEPTPEREAHKGALLRALEQAKGR